jgi:hypothetical protein
MRKAWLVGIFCLWGSSFILSQQISPLDLVIYPETHKGAFTGIGGGDANSFRMSSAASSAQGAFEFNFFTQENRRGNMVTWPIIFRYNFLTSSRIFQRDTFNVRNIAFVDNNQILNFGIRRRSLKQIGEDLFMINWFGDFSYNNFTSIDSANSPIRFFTINASVGPQLGLLMDTDVGPFGVMASIQGNFVTITDEEPASFERALVTSQSLSSNFGGFGGRLVVQFNDISIFIEGKKYYPIGKGANITGFTNLPIISFGGNAMGTLLTFKKKMTSHAY